MGSALLALSLFGFRVGMTSWFRRDATKHLATICVRLTRRCEEGGEEEEEEAGARGGGAASTRLDLHPRFGD